MKVSEGPIVAEQRLLASAASVWAAITQPNEMRRWYFEVIESFEARVGFETMFVVKVEDRVFPHRWNVIEVIPEEKIAYNWKYDGYAGDSNVTFDLIQDGDQTLLRLTHQVLEDFQDDIPEFSRESCLGGWNYFIGERLREYFKKDNS